MTNSKPSIALIGGGKMGRALVQGMINAGFTDAENVTVGEPISAVQAWWKENIPAATVSNDNNTIVSGADVVLIAVKPVAVEDVIDEIKEAANDALLVSIAAGIQLDTLCDLFGNSRVIRVMPNTPCLVGGGASAFCCGDDVTNADVAVVEAMLSSVGLSVQVSDSLMDGVTALSGSGPAYVCMMIEALADGGVLAGLPRDLAMRLATQTLLGTAKLVQETGDHPAVLKDAVASPGGTTIAGIAALEEAGLRNALIAAVEAGALRSEELAEEA